MARGASRREIGTYGATARVLAFLDRSEKLPRNTVRNLLVKYSPANYRYSVSTKYSQPNQIQSNTVKYSRYSVTRVSNRFNFVSHISLPHSRTCVKLRPCPQTRRGQLDLDIAVEWRLAAWYFASAGAAAAARASFCSYTASSAYIIIITTTLLVVGGRCSFSFSVVVHSFVGAL